GARDLPSFGLKDIARHLGVAAPDRTYIDAADVPRLWAADPERLVRYALDDATETLAISDLLSPPYFAQAQLLPFDYQSAVLRGNATKIDALLLREYLRHRRAPADLQDPDQLVLRLPRLLPRPLERLRGGQPCDRGGPGRRHRDRRSPPGARRHRDRDRHGRRLLRAARGRAGPGGGGAAPRVPGRRAPAGDPGRARRALPGDAQLQNEELRPARRQGRAHDPGLGAPVARSRAVPAPDHGGALRPAPLRPAGGDRRPRRPLEGGLRRPPRPRAPV